MKTTPIDDRTNSPTDAQSQLLRAHVEREVRRSAVIMVTSAERRDGKSVTAYSLALSLAQAGHRTALVAASHPIPGTREAGLVFRSMPEPEVGRFRETIADFLTASRSTYDYTIVDTAPLLADTMALALVGSVDGVIVTVRVGRAPADDDESTMRIIEQSNGRMLGIVAAKPDAIDDFERRRPASGLERGARRPVATGTVAPMQSLHSLAVVGLAILLISSIFALSSANAGAANRGGNLRSQGDRAGQVSLPPTSNRD